MVVAGILLILPELAVVLASRAYFSFGTSFSLVWPAIAGALGALMLCIGICTLTRKPVENPE
jgi:hypothetical protein